MQARPFYMCMKVKVLGAPQVRSLKMDVKVWDRSVVALFGAVGNDVANGAWEENLAQPLRAPLPLPPGLARPLPGDAQAASGAAGPQQSLSAGPRGSPDTWVAIGDASDDEEDDYNAARWRSALLSNVNT